MCVYVCVREGRSKPVCVFVYPFIYSGVIRHVRLQLHLYCVCVCVFLGNRLDSLPPVVQIQLIDWPPCGYVIDPLTAKPQRVPFLCVWRARVCVTLLVTERCSFSCPSHHPLKLTPIDHRYALAPATAAAECVCVRVCVCLCATSNHGNL